MLTSRKEKIDLDYRQRTIMFDLLCGKCQDAVYEVVIKTRIQRVKSIEEARSIILGITANTTVVRRCEQNNANLYEITNNKCLYWNPPAPDPDEQFIETPVVRQWVKQ